MNSIKCLRKTLRLVLTSALVFVSFGDIRALHASASGDSSDPVPLNESGVERVSIVLNFAGYGNIGIVAPGEKIESLTRRGLRYLGRCGYYGLQIFQWVMVPAVTYERVLAAYEEYDRRVAEAFRQFNQCQAIEGNTYEHCSEILAAELEAAYLELFFTLLEVYGEAVRWIMPDTIQFPAEIAGYCIEKTVWDKDRRDLPLRGPGSIPGRMPKEF